RFAPDLSLLSDAGCWGPPRGRSVAIAPTRSGYVVAVAGDGGVTVQSLGPSGQPRGAARLIASPTSPALVARSNGGAIAGGPLLTWAVPPMTDPKVPRGGP